MGHPSDWPLSLALAAAVVAVVLRLSRARNLAEWTAVALFCATVIAALAERLGWTHFGAVDIAVRGDSWATRLGADVLLVGGLLLLARVSRFDGRGERMSRLARASCVPAALLGYVVRDPTALGIAGWAATTAVWVAAMARRRAK